MPRRRTFVQLAAASVALPFAARAQSSFPSRPVRLVVPNAPGGAADITARTVGQAMSAGLGQPVVIENKPGAGGVVAGETVARAEPDGHALLLVSSGTAVSAALFQSLPFNTVRDFSPVSLLATFNLVLVAAEGGRFRSLADVLAYARANPGKLNIGSPQVGTTQHLAAELFKTTAGLDAQVVPFNGTPPVITALRSGEIDVGVDILGPLRGQLGQKALRALALLGERREPTLPDVPLVRESGGALAQFNASSWNGLAVPARTPGPVIERLNREVQAALGRAEVKAKLEELGLHPQGSTPGELAVHLANDIRRWSDVIAKARIPRQ